MIVAVTQTLTKILVENSALIRDVEIDLNHPDTRQDMRPALSLYLYELTKSNHGFNANSFCGSQTSTLV